MSYVNNHDREDETHERNKCWKHFPMRKVPAAKTFLDKKNLVSMPLVLVIECPKHTQNKESNIFLVTRY